MARLKGLPPRLAPAPRAVGYVTRAEAERARDQRRAAENPLRKLYASKRWRDPETGVRARIIARDGGACRMCGVLCVGRHPAPNSPEVDHIEPHRGNLLLFWDESNLQLLCKACHGSKKQAEERAAEGHAPRG